MGYQEIIIADAPSFYWKLDNTYLDAMGNAAEGVPVSGVFGAAKYGAASASFNGASGYINVAHHALMNFSTNVDFTVEAWVKKTAGATIRYIVDHRSAGGTGWVFYHVASTDQLYLTIAATNFAGPAIPEDGNYHHVVAVVDRDANVTFYLDGSPTVVATVPNQNTDATSQLTIGGRSYTQPSNVFTGLVDEVSIFRRALTQADIARHFLGRISGADGMNGGFTHLAGGMN